MADAPDGYIPTHVDKVLMSERGGVVLLVTDREPYVGKVLPVFVDTGQAVNIQLALTNELPPRPFTHDLLTTILNELGALVVELRIDELAQNTFFSTLRIEIERAGESVVETFDARPSDGIALALRADAPIMIAESVLEQAMVDPEEFFGELEQA
jgi:uncharacterized protein